MVPVSVIVPVYNKEKYLSSSIGSLLQQTFENFELICVDDGSTDHSGRILDELQTKDSRIRVFHTSNQGPSAARNFGLKQASGEFIAFVDSDDLVAPNYLEILYAEALESQSDVVICRRKTVPELTAPLAVDSPVIKRYSTELMEKFLLRKLRISVEPYAKLFRREILPEIVFTPNIYFEDYEFIYTRFFKYVKSLSSVEDEMYFIVQSPDSVMRSNFNSAKLNSWFVILENARRESSEISEKWRNIILYKVHNKAFHQLLKGIVSIENVNIQTALWNEFNDRLKDSISTGTIQKKYLKRRYRRLMFFIKILPEALNLKLLRILGCD